MPLVAARFLVILFLAAALQPASSQSDELPFSDGDDHYVGGAAQEMRDAYLSNHEHIVPHTYDPEKGLQAHEYGHMPQISFEAPRGVEDAFQELANIRVIAHNVQDNPFNATLWVEHHDGDVVYLRENAAHGQFDVHEEMKVPGTRLIPYNLDDAGLWVGQVVVAGHPQPASPKDET